MRLAAITALALLAAACKPSGPTTSNAAPEDPRVLVAACTLDADRTYASAGVESRLMLISDFVATCMRSHGLQIDFSRPGCSAGTAPRDYDECYGPLPAIGTASAAEPQSDSAASK